MAEVSDICKQLDTIPKRLQYFSKHCPNKDLFVFCSKSKRESYTTTRLLEIAGKFASRLQRQGFKSGDVIVNTLPNSPERLITDLGITLAGCVAMNGQILLADGSDFFRSAWQAKCRAVILCPEERSPAWRLFRTLVADQGCEDLFCPVSCDEAVDLDTAVLVWPRSSERSLLADLESSDDRPHLDLCRPDDILYIFTTSGSTGYSKLVHKTHAEELEQATGFATAMKCDSFPNESICFNERPLGWAGGFPHVSYLKGQTSIYSDALAADVLDTADLLGIITREKCSWSFLSIHAMDTVAKCMIASGLTTPVLDLMLMGGQPTTKSQVQSVLRLAVQAIVAYGSTEAGFMTSDAVGIDDVDEFQDYCCGKAVRGTTVRVVDEKGVECAAGTVGQILLKAEMPFSGYFSRQKDYKPESPMTDDGWFQQGDYGYVGQNGKLYVMGRTKDVLMYGGAVLYPGWLESKIVTHPEILEAMILPVSDPVLHHNICACVQIRDDSKLGKDEIDEFCRGLFISDVSNEFTPMPKFFMIYKSSEIPRTTTGKSDKVKLCKRAEELFGLRQK